MARRGRVRRRYFGQPGRRPGPQQQSQESASSRHHHLSSAELGWLVGARPRRRVSRRETGIFELLFLFDGITALDHWAAERDPLLRHDTQAIANRAPRIGTAAAAAA